MRVPFAPLALGAVLLAPPALARAQRLGGQVGGGRLPVLVDGSALPTGASPVRPGRLEPWPELRGRLAGSGTTLGGWGTGVWPGDAGYGVVGPGLAARTRHRPVRPLVIVVPPGLGVFGAYGYGYDAYAYGATGWGVAAGAVAPPAGRRRAPDPEDADAADADAPDGAPARTRVYTPEPDAPAAGASRADVPAPTAERLPGGLLRLRWAGDAGAARAVTLVVADSARRVLAAQTVAEAPFTAVFERGARVAFVGATVVWADHSSTTTLVPLRAGWGPARRAAR